MRLREPASVDQIKLDMKNNKYNSSEDKAIIAGSVEKQGVYMITEGNHRAVAAKELYEETGSSTYLENLIKNERWTFTENHSVSGHALHKR